MENPFSLMYWDEPTLWSAAFSIVITPIYWMLVAWLEYHCHLLRHMFCSRHVAAFIFAISQIFMLSYRNVRFLVALQYQPKWTSLQENPLLWLGYSLFIIGIYLVLRSFFLLGFIVTFMGDFFGLYLPDKIVRFPYTWMAHPMYTGSFMMFLGIAIVDTCQAGLFLSMLAGFMYLLAAIWEEQYTDLFCISHTKGSRTVAVQVSCTTQLIRVAARTVATQTGGDVSIISSDSTEQLQVEIEGENHKETEESDEINQIKNKSKLMEEPTGKDMSEKSSADDEC